MRSGSTIFFACIVHSGQFQAFDRRIKKALGNFGSQGGKGLRHFRERLDEQRSHHP